MAKKNFIPAEEFARLREIYVKGSMTVRDLFDAEAKQPGRNFKTFQARVSREVPKWSQLRKEHLQRIEDQRDKAGEKALSLTATTQTDTRVKYAIRARRMADLIMQTAENLRDGANLTPMDIQRLTGALRQAEQTEFAALGIAAEHIEFQDEDADGTLMTIEELLKAERAKKGLEPYEFGR